jgi:ribonuclease BN (tRNA processing enzyme)
MKTVVRLFIILAAMLFMAPSGAQSTAPQAATSKGTRLILLGTAGGPSIKKSRAQPANALIVNGSVYIIDTGNGVARQMALANVSPQALRAVFITHLHSDHTADYGTLLLRAWLTGLKKPVDTYGPAPLEDMTRAYMRYMDWDIQLRISDENRPPFAPLVRAHNIAGEGVIFQDENVKVTAVEVPHGAAKPSYAFRFDTPTRSIVFSGDTSRSSSLVRLAKGADILVHEVLNTEGVDAAVGIAGVANEALKRHIIEAHTPTEEVGQVARDAGVKKLVLTHFVPSLPAFDKPEIWIQGVRKFYDGEIIVGQDLLEIE